MFFTDTMQETREIWAFHDYEKTGMSAPYEVFARPAGKPDGSAVDSEGCLWNAEFGGGRVIRYLPDGSVDAIVTLPTMFSTCVAFGDADLRTLYITDASPKCLSKRKSQH
eukprot:gnl/TRDRNA2_/TRDRNA2_171593_c0_seq5.p2 gnl/TRDRNA2_/TRDRNA2_171593_c0~~gnl/TRDRNA2_/TRDRNA2_171593_c0_seq5.p2  ORF type:complete len:110 (+),score=10.42 gnl/TRDRNA2_/TRDRNA2_171593_c0_seq5:342-671(+)